VGTNEHHELTIQLAWNWGAKAGLFYAGTNLLCNIWCWFRLPETKDRTFGEIDLMFDNRVPARKFKHTRVDRKSRTSVRLQNHS
jgi:SP family general alpha glucoside:H+ symporter-like MFS transporter